MANAHIARNAVHAWSDDIGENTQDHQAALGRLMRDQKRLGKFVAENAASMNQGTGGISTYMITVVTRIFDLAGGRLKGATWAQVRAAEAKVMEAVPELLPLDEGLPARARSISWRAQPHILDEALMALFETDTGDSEQEVDQAELLKIYLLMWVGTEVLDQNWRPPKNFDGSTEYEYVHIEPKPAPKSEESE